MSHQSGDVIRPTVRSERSCNLTTVDIPFRHWRNEDNQSCSDTGSNRGVACQATLSAIISSRINCPRRIADHHLFDSYHLEKIKIGFNDKKLKHGESGAEAGGTITWDDFHSSPRAEVVLVSKDMVGFRVDAWCMKRQRSVHTVISQQSVQNAKMQ